MALDGVTVSAPAKINLRLKVLAREVTGYHQIETVFAAIDLADELTLERAGTRFELHVTGDAGGATGADNLVMRAAAVWADASGIRAGVTMRLVKRIPAGAGLGGGSSDAAATLRGLQALFGHPLSDDRLMLLAAGLGADVPFFLSPSPWALGWGRGDRLLPLAPPPARELVIALPPLHVSTAEAYAGLAAAGIGGGPVGALLMPRSGDLTWDALGALAENDFEESVAARFPELTRLRQSLRETRPALVLMTGSGAAHFAIYSTGGEADQAWAQLRQTLPHVRFERARTLESVSAVG